MRFYTLFFVIVVPKKCTFVKQLFAQKQTECLRLNGTRDATRIVDWGNLKTSCFAAPRLFYCELFAYPVTYVSTG